MTVKWHVQKGNPVTIRQLVDLNIVSTSNGMGWRPTTRLLSLLTGAKRPHLTLATSHLYSTIIPPMPRRVREAPKEHPFSGPPPFSPPFPSPVICLTCSRPTTPLRQCSCSLLHRSSPMLRLFRILRAIHRGLGC